MAIRLYVIGKTKESHFIASEKEYLQRIGKYASFSYEVIPSARNQTRASICLQMEEVALLKKIQDTDFVVLLDEKGKSYTSRNFAEQLAQWTNQYPDLIFVIGGAFGVSSTVRKRANAILTLSAMTFPHHLVRTMFLEQLYRAFTINRGEKYHND